MGHTEPTYNNNIKDCQQSHGRVQNRQESDILVKPQETTQNAIWKDAIYYKIDHQFITLHIPDSP